MTNQNLEDRAQRQVVQDFRQRFLPRPEREGGLPSPAAQTPAPALSSLAEVERPSRGGLFALNEAGELPQQEQVDIRALVSERSMQEQVDAKESLFGRIGGGILAVGDWIQRNIDAPIPGALSLTFGMASRTDVSAVEAVAASIDFAFTGANDLVEREFRRVGAKLPESDDPLARWQAFGDYQIKRPGLFWGEKFIEELLLSPANLVPFSRISKATKVGMFWPKVSQSLQWKAVPGNPLQRTLRSRRAGIEGLTQTNIGMMMEAVDPATGRQLADFSSADQVFEMKRRISSFWEGDDAAQRMWGDQWRSAPVRRTQRALRKAFPDRAALDTFLDEDAPQATAEMLSDIMRKTGIAEVGGRSLRENRLYRFQQKIKSEITPFTLFLTGRYNVYNALNNAAMLGFRHSTRVAGLRSANRFVDKLGIREAGGFGPDRLLRTDSGWSRELVPGSTQLRGAEEWQPWITKVPIVGDLFRASTALSQRADNAVRGSDFALTAMKEWKGEWGRQLRLNALPDDVQTALSKVVGPDDLEATLGRLASQTPSSAVDLAPVGNLPPIARSYFDEAAEALGRPVESLDDLRVASQRARESLRRHYRDVADEARIEYGNVMEAEDALFERHLDDLTQLASNRKVDRDAQQVIQAEIDRLRGQKQTFANDWNQDQLVLDQADAAAAAASMVEQAPALQDLRARAAEMRNLWHLRDRRQFESYYRQIVETPTDELKTRLPELARRNAERRTAIRKEFVGRIKTMYDDFNRELEAIPVGQRSGIRLSDLDVPSRLPRETLDDMLREAGLDPKVYDPDVAPDISALVMGQGDKELRALDDMLRQTEEGWRRAQSAPRAGARITQEQAEAVRQSYNGARAATQRRALDVVESDFFDYANRNYVDYFLNHLMPYPFWSTRYLNYWITRSVQNPNQARALIRAVGEWVKASEDEAPHNRFSVKVFTMPGGTEVRYSPLGGILPIAYPFIDVMQPGRETNDLVQGVAKLQDFVGGYFYPTTELMISALGAIAPNADVTRTGGRGIARTPKEVFLDLLPQMGLLTTGINAFGYNQMTALAGDAILNERDKNAILYAISDDLNTGRLTDQNAAQEAVRSIVAGRPNALAAIYAKKALGKNLFQRVTSLVGAPLRLSAPEEKVTTAARKYLVPLTPEASGPPANEVDLLYKAYPGLEIVQGNTLPSGLDRQQADVYRLTSDYWEVVRRSQETRDAKLTALWQRYTANIGLSGDEYRDQRGSIWEEYIFGLNGALTQAVETAQQRGLPMEQVPLPIRRDETGAWVPAPGDAAAGRTQRDAFWQSTGRTLYPDNPLRLIEDGYYAIQADSFLDPVTGGIDWGAFFSERQRYLDGLDDVEYEYLRARTLDQNSPDAGYRIAQEIVRPYFQVRDAIAARDPEAADIEREAQIALFRGDTRRAERLRTHPRLRAIDRRVAREREKMRRRDKRLDAALVAFYGLIPIHRDWLQEAQRTFLKP